MILRSIITEGVPYTLQCREVCGGWADLTKPLFIITDDAGDLYAFARRQDAEHEWDRMFGRALAQQEAA